MAENTFPVPVNVSINGQFPSFYQKDGPLFVAFIKAYYEYLEQNGNVIYDIRNLQNYKDIDTTPDEFLQYFKDEYLGSLPTTLAVNPRLLIKHIQDLWRATGTKRGYELLFRILFNEDISFYFPGQNLFKPSNNTWQKQSYIEVSNSPILSQLIGLKIYSSSGLATAIVENYNVINTNNNIINILTLSHVTGNFEYGDKILCENLDISQNSPNVTGSLSAISIINGGVLFNLGDIVNISGQGKSGLGRVSSITQQNGKVIFNLVNGGKGFTISPQIEVTGGGGSGASFSVGSLIDQEVFEVNIEEINNYLNTQLENQAEGYTLGISNATASFTVGETVTSSANGLVLDISYISGNDLIINETLSNTSLGISGLYVIEIDNPNFLILGGPEASLNNANVLNSELIGSVSNSVITINTIIGGGETVFFGNGTVTFANSTILNVDGNTGYFLPSANITGSTSNSTAYINTTTRDTDWGFPTAGVNLSTPLDAALTFETLIVGTISSLSMENPGKFYKSNPNVSIIEPYIYQLQIPDGNGGYWGGDAQVNAIANNYSGIITSLQIIESGYGFIPGETVEINGNSAIFAEGTAIVDGTGITQGFWTDNQSFPSDTLYLQDSFYYQPFAYEIVAPRMLETYKQFVLDIVHPVQMNLFGRFSINDFQSANTSLIS